MLDGEDIHRLPSREVARRLGLLPQTPIAPEGLSVEDLVARGRYPHQRWFRQWSPEDEAAVERALTLTDIGDLRHRPVDELSGGQRQRAWIAMALAQETPLLLLDEPTTYLDLAHQIEVLDLLHRLNAEEGRTIVIVIHDLNLACRYVDHLVAMADGRIRVVGRPADVVSEAMVREIFGVECRILPDPVIGCAHGPAGRSARPPPRGDRERSRHGLTRAGPSSRRSTARPPRSSPPGDAMPTQPTLRRRVTLAGAAVLLALAPTSALAQSPSAAPAASSAPDASGAGFPLEIEHKYGTTVIEAPPERIVTVGLLEQDPLLALGDPSRWA